MSIAYYDNGAGKPLVLLHDNGAEHSYYQEQFDHFETSRRLLAPDLPGHGLTPRGEEPLSLDRAAREVVELLDRLDVKKADFIGQGDGANIALRIALQRPDLVDRLVLAGAWIDPSGYNAFTTLSLKWARKVNGAMGRIAGTGSNACSNTNAALELVDLQTEPPYLTLEQLSAVTCPTLVVTGKKDIIRPEHTAAIAAAIPGARLEVLAGNHYIPRQMPNTFNRLLDEFFGKTE